MIDISASLSTAISEVAVYALPLVLGITLHVAAQAYAARHFGDTTAEMEGRVSFNPANHIDPFGTIAMPLIFFLLSSLGGVPLVFGYAKPLPIKWSNLHNPKRDMLWIALAGIGINFLMALAWYLLANVLKLAQFEEPFFSQMALAGVRCNLILMTFYLLPLPPFDGGRIVFSLLPNKQAEQFARIEPYTFFIVMALIITRVLPQYWIGPIYDVLVKILLVIVSPLNFLFT
jgi:Zn-dependent protease